MEHRWGQRVPIGIEVRLACRPYAIGAGWMRDASMSGAFLRTELAPPPLARVRIEINVERPDGRRGTRQLLAHVVRHDATGIGVEWCSLDPVGMAELLSQGCGPGVGAWIEVEPACASQKGY